MSGKILMTCLLAAFAALALPACTDSGEPDATPPQATQQPAPQQQAAAPAPTQQARAEPAQAGPAATQAQDEKKSEDESTPKPEKITD